MPKIKKEEANESDFWMWSQTYEDATADLNWCGENLEQTDKKWINRIQETGPFQGHPILQYTK